jgi:hypothetical protein
MQVREAFETVMSGSRPPRRAFAGALVFCVSAILRADEPPARPLPDTAAFIEEVRQNLRSDRLLLEQYTFTEKRVEQRLDGKGVVKTTKTETFEVYPSLEPGKMYRRRITRDGVPLGEKELAEQDRRHEAKAEKVESRGASDAEDRREEERVVAEIPMIYDVDLRGRETMDGRSVIVVEFAPRPGYKAVTTGGKVLQKVAGRAWIDEEDRQLVRVEAKLLDNLGVGPAGVVRLQKGATSYFHRRKVNDEIWLPSDARFTGAARVLLFFGGSVDARFVYSDYRKFSVSTDTATTPAPPEPEAAPPQP